MFCVGQKLVKSAGSALLLALIAFVAVSPGVSADTKSDQSGNIFAFNRRLGSGINLGNGLDAPHEGEWGVTLQADYFKSIKAAGFSHVRLPVRWETHCLPRRSLHNRPPPL